MFDKNIISHNFHELDEFIPELKKNFIKADPFPHIVIKNFFNESFLNKILEDFPNLNNASGTEKYNNENELKLANNRFNSFPQSLKNIFKFLNSSDFLKFLQQISSINEKLEPDLELNGGGLHEIKRGGVLKIHTDFNKHPSNGMDRRVNLLLYLNKNWLDSYGGCLELWDQEMTKCVKKIKPEFNTMVIFNTNDFSNHGHPDPLNCPINLSRKSIATYYFSKGRPQHEINSNIFKNKTYFKNRVGFKNDTSENKEKFKNFFRSFKIYQKLKNFEKKYLRKKNK